MRSEILTKPTYMAAMILEQYVRPGDRVVDATSGTGQDASLLLELVGRDGKIYAFDIQQEALNQTASLLSLQGENCDGSGVVILINRSHSEMEEHVKEPVQAVVFNLGYLPGGDKSVTTRADETLKAVAASLRILNCGGVLVITMYSGHDEGVEKEAVLNYLRQLDPKGYHCVHMPLINQKGYPPEVVAVVKK